MMTAASPTREAAPAEPTSSRPTTPPAEGAISRVRHRSFRAVRLVATVVGIPHAMYMLTIVLQGPRPATLGLLAVGLEVLAIAVSWLLTERTHRVGAILYILTVSLLASVVLRTVGMTVGAGVAFAWASVATAVFLGMRASVLAFAGVALELLIYGVWRQVGGAPGPWPGAVLVSTPIFVRYALALLSGIGMLLATVAVVVRGFEAATRELGEALARERAAHQAREAGEAERSKLEQILRGAQKIQALGTLAGGVVHDVNNALSVILACAGELAQAIPEDRRGELDAITCAARSSSVLTRRLLSLARQDASGARPVDIQPLLQSLAEVLRRTLPKNIVVSLRDGASPDRGNALRVVGHRSDLEHAVLNLALNARDAMPAGGTLSLSCRAGTLPAPEAARHPGVAPGPCVEITVEDTGSGIEPEALPHIFEPLFTTKGDEGGTGLGLFSVDGVIRGHRGVIRVLTEPGKGTRFTMLLPAASSDTPLPETNGTKPPTASCEPAGGGSRVAPARLLDK